MRWGDFRKSDNVDDRTSGDPGGGSPLGGGGMRLGGGALVVIVIASLIFGVNPLEMIGALESGAPGAPPATQGQTPPGYGPQGNPTRRRRVRATRPRIRQRTSSRRSSAIPKTSGRPCSSRSGARYEPPRLVLFRRTTRSACGRASASTGPFYCSADRELYLDTDFFNELSRRFGAPGDFAQAYVIAHEVGHHVQNLTGTMKMVDQKMQAQDARGRNALSVRLELQADCYAGIWGFYAQKRNKLEAGDLEEGFRAASAVGDDSIQKRAQGYVVPESFTHGSAEQRLRWFRTGLESGDMRRCNTFAPGGPD